MDSTEHAEHAEERRIWMEGGEGRNRGAGSPVVRWSGGQAGGAVGGGSRPPGIGSQGSPQVRGQAGGAVGGGSRKQEWEGIK